MRLHVVGLSGQGNLLALHLRRNARLLAKTDGLEVLRKLPNRSVQAHLPDPFGFGVTLRLRRNRANQELAKGGRGIVVERGEARLREHEFDIQWADLPGVDGAIGQWDDESMYPTLAGHPICESLGYPKGTIDTLVVTSKPQHTLPLLQRMVPLLSPASTVILVQNAQGVVDLLVRRLFPDPLKRPNIVLANSTHETSVLSPLYAQHSHFGQIDFGVIPNQNTGRDFERIWAPRHFFGDGGLDQAYPSSDPAHFPGDEGARIETEGGSNAMGGHGWFARRAQLQQSSLDRSFATAATPREMLNMAPQGRSLKPTLDLAAIPTNDNTRTLTASLAMLLSLPLDVTWQPIRRFQLVGMRNLVASACIEPLTALTSCRNGDLFGNQYAEEIIQDICREASAILRTMAERTRTQALNAAREGSEAFEDNFAVSSSQDLIGDFRIPDNPQLDPSLTSAALAEMVRQTIRNSAPQYSTMHRELHSDRGKDATAIYYLNGYLHRLGRALNIPTPTNDMLVSMINLKQSRFRRPAWATRDMPL